MLSRRAFLSATLASSCLAGNQAIATTSACRVDELWVMSSRRFGCNEPNDTTTHLWHVQRRESTTSWRGSSFVDFQAAMSDGWPLVVYIHGNRNDSYWAMKNGQALYQALVRCNPCATPFRFMIYSWPSEETIQRRPLRDARYKDCVANGEIYKFGWLASQLNAVSSVSIISFSLGGKICTGGLHLLAGGAWQGKSLPTTPRPAMRAMLWAAALDCGWLASGAPHGLALNAVDCLANYYNPLDPVLRRYPKISDSGRDAVGYVGLGSVSGGNVSQVNASGQVGKGHELVAYLESESIMRATRSFAFWQPA